MSGDARGASQAEFMIGFRRLAKGRYKLSCSPKRPLPRQRRKGRPPKLALVLALGHLFERLFTEGHVVSYTEMARLTGLTRARVSQIASLTLLAPKVQEDIVSGRITGLFERDLRALTTGASFDEQRKCLKRILEDPRRQSLNGRRRSPSAQRVVPAPMKGSG